MVSSELVVIAHWKMYALNLIIILIWTNTVCVCVCVVFPVYVRQICCRNRFSYKLFTMTFIQISDFRFLLLFFQINKRNNIQIESTKWVEWREKLFAMLTSFNLLHLSFWLFYCIAKKPTKIYRFHCKFTQNVLCFFWIFVLNKKKGKWLIVFLFFWVDASEYLAFSLS